MPLTMTCLAPPRARTSLNPVLGRLDDVTAGIAAERRAAPAQAALVVVARWRDEHRRERVGCWLRIAPPDGGPIALSLGAHHECDVSGVLGASLRHALLVLDPLRRPDDVEVIDLRTTEGLRYDGGDDVRHVIARGVARFGAGTADVLALPLAPGELVRDGIERARAAPELRIPVIGPLEWLGHFERSICEAAPGHRLASRDLVTHIGLDGGAAPSHGCPVHVTERELVAGVLLGRAERCVAGDVDLRISRVHAWVQARGDRLLVADVGSSNGTAVTDDGAGVRLTRGRRAAVCSRHATLLLAGFPFTLRVKG